MTESSWRHGSVVLGCGTIGGIGGSRRHFGLGLDDEQAVTVLDEGRSLGITMFDTAQSYGGGVSDATIGRWRRERDIPGDADPALTTKVAPSDSPGLFTYEHLSWGLDESLARLGVERVEWFLTHSPDPTTPIEATLEGLEAIRESGRCVHVGGCNLDEPSLARALEAAERLGVRGYELVQNGFSLLTPDADAEVRRTCRDQGLAFVAFSPLAGGTLTGRYRRGEALAPGSRLALRPDGVDELLTPATFDALDYLGDVARERDLAPGALALAWLIHHDDVTALITGPARSAPHLELAAIALEVDLNPEVFAELGERFRAAR